MLDGYTEAFVVNDINCKLSGPMKECVYMYAFMWAFFACRLASDLLGKDVEMTLH